MDMDHNSKRATEEGVQGEEYQSAVLINDITDTCHICSCYDEVFIPLHTDEEEQNLGEMFMSITSLEIQYDKLIPIQMCTACRDNVIFCYQFKIKCQNAFNALQQVQSTKMDMGGRASILEMDVREIQMVDDEELGETDFHNDLNVKEEVLDMKNDVVEYLDENIFDEPMEPMHLDENISSKSTLSKMKKRVKVKQELKEKQTRQFHPCTICDKKFVNAVNLKSHMKIHNTEDKNFIDCRHCHEKFGSEHDLKVHSALHTKGNKWNCSKCNKEFIDRAAFRRHIRRHFNTKVFACDWCEKQFTELCGLRRHERVHTGELRESPHKCTLCEKRYSSKYLLKAHMSRHTGARPCTCDVCGKSFRSTRLLNSHKLTHSDHKAYPCPLCDKRFRHDSTRKTHLLTHTGEKPYVCSACGKTFRQKSNLTLHMRSHTGEKPYACELCPRSFRSTSALTTHMSSHSKDKPFACTICGKKFLRQSLTCHMRLHTGERAFACPACPKRFFTASRLKEHSRIHTDEKPFECKYCGTQFKKKISLTNHVKRHESKKVNEKTVRKASAKAKLKVIIDNSKSSEDNSCSDMNLQITEVPIAVSEELVLQDDSNVKTELIVIDEELIPPQLLDGITVKLYHIDQGLVHAEV